MSDEASRFLLFFGPMLLLFFIRLLWVLLRRPKHNPQHLTRFHYIVGFMRALVDACYFYLCARLLLLVLPPESPDIVPMIAVTFCLLWLFSEFAYLPALKQRPKLPSRRTIVLLLCWQLMVVLVGFIVYFGWLRGYPLADRPALRLADPLEGRWRVAAGGRHEFLNYHHDRPARQNYAVDLVTDDPSTPAGGQTVFAPADGIVERASNDFAGGAGPAEGNVVELRLADGTLLLLAHLATGSVRVQPGEHVSTGQHLAAVGATGSAESPHLHIHAERDGRPVPLLLDSDFPIRGDVIDFR